MTRLNMLRKYAATSFAFVALVVANLASTQFSIIYYQREIPEILKETKK